MPFKLFSAGIDALLVVLTLLLIVVGPYGWAILVAWRLYGIQYAVEERHKEKRPH